MIILRPYATIPMLFPFLKLIPKFQQISFVSPQRMTTDTKNNLWLVSCHQYHHLIGWNWLWSFFTTINRWSWWQLSLVPGCRNMNLDWWKTITLIACLLEKQKLPTVLNINYTLRFWRCFLLRIYSTILLLKYRDDILPLTFYVRAGFLKECFG